MIWIPITDVDGKPQYVNANLIERLEPHDTGTTKTRMWFIGNEQAYLRVRETCLEILELINKERALIRAMTGE